MQSILHAYAAKRIIILRGTVTVVTRHVRDFAKIALQAAKKAAHFAFGAAPSGFRMRSEKSGESFAACARGLMCTLCLSAANDSPFVTTPWRS